MWILLPVLLLMNGRFFSDTFPCLCPPAHGGNVCVLDGSVYQNGQTFFPSCKYQCMCRDGQIGCVPRCNVDVMLPGPDCPVPRRVQVPGECCEKWVCDPQTEASALGGFAMAGEYSGSRVRWDEEDHICRPYTDRHMQYHSFLTLVSLQCETQSLKVMYISLT